MWPFLKPLTHQESLPNKTCPKLLFCLQQLSPYSPPKNYFKAEDTEVSVCSNNQTRKQIVLQQYDPFHQSLNKQSQKNRIHVEL